MSGERDVTISLTEAQIARVVREASGATGLAAVLSGLSDVESLAASVLSVIEDKGHSRATLRALLVLAAFPADGTERELTDVANELHLSAATTHRYLRTWTAVGLLERHPDSRLYRRAPLRVEQASREQDSETA